MDVTQLEEILLFSNKLLKKPQIIVENENDGVSKQTLSMIKLVHDVLIKESSKFKIKNENLVTANMSEEQIWEQLTIHLNTLDKVFEKYVVTLPEAQSDQESEEEQDGDVDQSGQEQEQNDSDDEDDGVDDANYDEHERDIDLESEYEDEDEDEEQEKVKPTKSSQNKKKSEDKLAKKKGSKLNGYENEIEEEVEKSDISGNNEEEDDAENLFGKNEENEEYEEKLDFGEMEAFLDKQDEDDIMRDSEAEDELGSDYEMDDGDSMKGEGDKGFKFQGRDDFDDMNAEEEDHEEENDEENDKLREQDYDAEDQIFDLEREHLMNTQIEPKEDMERLKNEDEIDRLEKRLLGDKEWVQKGEIGSKARPVNSLVEQDVDFRKNLKATQEIDEAYNKNLESIIKQRVLDEAFDDRVRVNIEQNMKESFQNMAEISKEKSKIGLGDLYEADFKNSLGLPSNNKEDKTKLEIHNLFREVCYKLDALSNLSFTPKPVLKQPQISTNVPSLQREERIPVTVSNADTQRPEEVFDKRKQVTHHSKVEMNHDEKQTLRRQHKSAGRQRNKEAQKKQLIKNLQYKGQTKFEYNQVQKAKLNNKKLLEGKRQKSVEFTKSSEFFKNMQNNTQNQTENTKKQPINKTKFIKKN